jgi:hypothetical protein
VRVLAIGRAAFRYLERYATHLATLRILADLRVWFFAAIEPLAPARLATHRSGDLLARISADVDTLEDFAVRVVLPPIVAVMAAVFACLLLRRSIRCSGLVLLVFLGLAAVVLPLLTRRLSRRASATFVARRARCLALAVDQVEGRPTSRRSITPTTTGRGCSPRAPTWIGCGAARGRPGSRRRPRGHGRGPVRRRRARPGGPARHRWPRRRRLPGPPAARRDRRVRGRPAAAALAAAARFEPGRGRPVVRPRRRSAGGDRPADASTGPAPGSRRRSRSGA